MTEKKNGLVAMMMMVVSLLWITTLFSATEAVTLTFNVKTATHVEYSALLTNLSKVVTDPSLNYGGTGLPVIAAPPNPSKFLYVDLVSGKKTITIGLDMSNLYVLGYLENLSSTGGTGTKDRAQYFKDAPKNATTQLFPQKPATQLKYTGSYPSIEAKAKIGRSKVPLARSTLKSKFDKVYAKTPVVDSDQAQFLLTIIQMFSEAARSKYIETMIADNFDKEWDYYTADPKAISLENEWGKISKGIKNSVNGVINPPLTDVVDVHGNKQTISKVSDIVGDMALLNYVPAGSRGLSLYSEMLMSPSSVGNDDSGIHDASG